MRIRGGLEEVDFRTNVIAAVGVAACFPFDAAPTPSVSIVGLHRREPRR
jgi:hypothetical protein